MIKLCIPDIREAEIAAAIKAIKSGWLTHGPCNKEFERVFSDYVGVKHAITCNSCTSALFLALKILDIKGEVITPSFSFTATANAIVTAGATPRFVDVDYDTCNIDPDKVRKAITPRTEAIMPVHFAGQCCKMDEIMEIAKQHRLHIIEDTAETIGGTFKGKQAGSFGIGCFSFFPTKNITTGEGGMLTTNDDNIARKARALIGHGFDSTTHEREKAEMPWFRSAVMPGYNFRMSNVLAAIGIEQMKRIDEMNQARISNAKYLVNGLIDLVGLELPHSVENCEHVYQMFTVKLVEPRSRNAFVSMLNRKGIGASVHFYPAIHEQAYYETHTEWIADSLEVTKKISRSIVTLPLFPRMTINELDHVICKVKSCLARLD